MQSLITHRLTARRSLLRDGFSRHRLFRCNITSSDRLRFYRAFWNPIFATSIHLPYLIKELLLVFSLVQSKRGFLEYDMEDCMS
jgi:hypothetical protein